MREIDVNKLVITGLGVSTGQWSSLEIYERAIYDGEKHHPVVPGGTDSLYKAALAALTSANLTGTGSEVALVTIGETQDGEVAGKLAAQTGLKIQATATQDSLSGALDLAGQLLADNQATAVLVTVGGGAALVLQSASRSGTTSFAAIETQSTVTAGYLEIVGGENAQIATELSRTFPQTTAHPTCALGGLQPVGEAERPLATMLALIKTALCLKGRYIPSIPGWEGPQNPSAWQGSAFYVADRARTWFLEKGQDRRVAALLYPEPNGSFSQLVLAEQSGHERPVKYDRATSGHQLFLLAGADLAALQVRLSSLKRQLQEGLPLAVIARQAFLEFRRRSKEHHVLALVAGTPAELQHEIEKAESGVPTAFSKGREWKTTGGSYFTPNPLGEQAPVAFVYPGAFNSYPGLGQDLFRHFPALYADFAGQVADPAFVLTEKLLYPRSLTPQPAEQAEETLTTDHNGMMLSGTSFALLFTRLLRDNFKVNAAASLGYSLGENSMLWSSGVWTDYDTGTSGFTRSEVFRTRLSGPKYAIREMWKLTPEQASGDFWAIFYVLAPVEKVRAAVQDEPRVYLTHINTSEEVVISGDTEACHRVIAKLKCHYLRTSYTSVLHCEPVSGEYAEFVRFNTVPSRPVPGITLYSAADYAPLKMETQAIAETVSRMSCQQVDFPRLVERVYNDGARVFIELGAGNTCTRWIGKILKGRDPLAININQKGVKDEVGLLRVLAKLAAHHIPFDPSLLYEQPVHAQSAGLPNLHPERLHENAQLLAQAHGTFLVGRQASLGQLGDLLGQYFSQLGQELELGSGTLPQVVRQEPNPAPPAPVVPKPVQPKPVKPALFNLEQITEFAKGSVVKCFGPEYLPFENRRIARIPNTDLMFLSRVTSITGTRHNFEGISSIVVEYDVPEDVWFCQQNSYPVTPYSVHMEIALQPCGFLSAYKGSYFLFPDIDLFFRNLDGQSTLLREIDLRGKTVTTTARLLSSSTFEGTIIQRFEFETACEGEVYFKGNSAFGFFSKEAMAKQVGLDGGKKSLSWLEKNQEQAGVLNFDLSAGGFQAPQGKPYYRKAGKQLEFLDEVKLVPGAGQNGLGYIYATRRINPADWFYRCHFYGDPVMPGSLGVEGIIEAMQVFALQQGLGKEFKSPRFGMLPGPTVAWKYRGQIIPENHLMALEIHLTKVEKSQDRVIISGDASLWKDGLRIYEVKQLALVIQEA